MTPDGVEPVKRVKKMVENTHRYHAKGNTGSLNQGGPHVPDGFHALKKGRKRG